MRKLLMIGAAAAALATATPAMAGPGHTIAGGTAGAWTGGTIGFFLGGPIGAVIGGTIGGTTGAAIGSRVDDDYVFDRGGDVDISVDFRVGDLIDSDVHLRHIRGDDQYGYFRAHGLVYIVDLDSREVVEIREG